MSKVHKPKIIAGPEALLARRYATALLELAAEKKALEAVAADVQALQDAMDAEPLFQTLFKHPRLPLSAMQKFVKEVVVKAKFHELTEAFLVQVVKSRRMALLGLMIEVFQAELAQQRGEHTAYVTAAAPLSAEQETKLAKQLGGIVGGTVRLMVEQDANLMGGLVIKMDSRLIDASVQGKLARLERHLKSQQEAA